MRRVAWRVLARLDGWMNRVYGAKWNPLYQSGSIVVGLLVVLVVTGLYLLLFYRIGSPWASVARITEQVWLGRWIRGVHRFASDAALVATAVHAFRMYAQRRTWGPRALAWTSGLALVGLILTCGWTGYVMVWDVQALLLASEGARLLEVLPIFSEPISRTFVGERPLPSAFFFLNLFVHVALPITLGLVLWIHVSRVARPVLLPPRRLFWAVTAGLVVLAVMWPVAMAPEADVFRIPDGAPLNAFFAFWVPLTRRLPVWSVWAAAGVLVLVVALVPLWTRPPAPERLPKSVVNTRLCTGCEQCALDCPYDAISMVPREDGRPGLVALVDPALCVSCGICAGSCAPMATGPAGYTGREQLDAVRAFLAAKRPGPRDVVVVGCEWSAAAEGRLPADVLLFPVICAGNVHTSVIEFLIRGGAGGVLLVACPDRDCRGREGAKWLEQRVYHGREADLKERVDRRRVGIVRASAVETRLLAAELAAFRDQIARLDVPPPETEIDLVAECREPDSTAEEDPDLEEVAL